MRVLGHYERYLKALGCRDRRPVVVLFRGYSFSYLQGGPLLPEKVSE
jgi:hypothetical protein